MNTPHKNYIGRYAPSPTGDLHLGNIFSVLIAYARCKQRKGTFILRIEDIDEQRTIAGSKERIVEDLETLGILFDRGSETTKNFKKSQRVQQNIQYIQTKRYQIYQNYLNILQAKQLIYVCECSRKDIREASSAPHGLSNSCYQNTCRNKEISFEDAQKSPEKYSIRLKCPDQQIIINDQIYGSSQHNIRQSTGDFILKRKLGYYAYQFVVVVDDALMGVTEVVRGNDLLESTAHQQFLFEQLGFKVPQFAHHPILTDASGTRLSKRFKPETFRTLQAKGFKIDQIIGIIGSTLSLCKSGASLSLEDFIVKLEEKHLQKESVALPAQFSPKA